MRKWIDADALMDFLTIMPIDLGYREIDDVEEYVKRQPAADVTPVRHGRWETEIITDAYGLKHACYACSVCGVANNDEYDFCPNCGAKMDGGAG